MKWIRMDTQFFDEPGVQQLISERKHNRVLLYLFLIGEISKTYDVPDDSERLCGELEPGFLARKLNLQSKTLMTQLKEVASVFDISIDIKDRLLIIEIPNKRKFLHKDAFSSSKRNVSGGPMAGPEKKKEKKRGNESQTETLKEERRKAEHDEIVSRIQREQQKEDFDDKTS